MYPYPNVCGVGTSLHPHATLVSGVVRRGERASKAGRELSSCCAVVLITSRLWAVKMVAGSG
jgi:hypothetical protein